MDMSLFVEDCPGELIPVTGRRLETAFVPHPLPPNWDFPLQLWPRLAEAREKLGELNGIGQVLAHPQLLLRPLQDREALTSSRIEGTYVTPEQLLLYGLEPHEPGSVNDRAADWQEVRNYNIALEAGQRVLADVPLSNRVVLTMHRALMAGARGHGKSPGQFRTRQVQIGSTGRFVPPPADRVDRCMQQLWEFVNSESSLDPLIVCFLVHYQFEAIHPFEDGNGRVGRALLSLMVQQGLGHTMPWLYLSAFYDAFKDEYIDALFRVSTEGDWKNWINFCITGAIEQATDAIRRCHLFTDLKRQFHDMISEPSPRTHQIIDSLFESPVVNAPAISTRFDVTYNTARKDIRRLIDCGILAELPGAHPRAWYAPLIMQVAWTDDLSQVQRIDDLGH